MKESCAGHKRENLDRLLSRAPNVVLHRWAPRKVRTRRAGSGRTCGWGQSTFEIPVIWDPPVCSAGRVRIGAKINRHYCAETLSLLVRLVFDLPPSFLRGPYVQLGPLRALAVKFGTKFLYAIHDFALCTQKLWSDTDI